MAGSGNGPISLPPRPSRGNPPVIGRKEMTWQTRSAAIKEAAAEINLLWDELIGKGWEGTAAQEAAIKCAPVIVQKRLH